MTKSGEDQGVQNPIVPSQGRPLQRRIGESEQAFAARLAYCRLEPNKRSVVGAYRVIKELPPDAKVRAPGYFSRWAAKFGWKESAVDWDLFFEGLAITRNAEELAVIQQTAAAQAKQVQELIAREIEALQTPARGSGLLGWLSRLLPGQRRSRIAELAALGAAFESIMTGSFSAQNGLRPPSDWE